MARIVKKAAERRSEIVQAARRLFQTKNYANATMQDLMETLGVAKGTIYHYFKSKEALLEAVVEDIVENNIAEMRTLIEKSTGNALEKIQTLIKKGNISADNRALLDYLHEGGNEAMHVRLLAATLMKQAPLYGKLIEQGCKEGLFQTETPLECAEFVLSAVQFLTDLGIYRWTEGDLTRRAHAFPRLIEQMLNAPKGSFQFLEQPGIFE